MCHNRCGILLHIDTAYNTKHSYYHVVNMTMNVSIVLVGEISKPLLTAVKNHLTSLGFEAEITQSRSVPDQAYNAHRDQYKARAFIEMMPRTGDYHLVITDVDIYVRDYNFVFGLASGSNAVISITRLTGDKLQERTIKEAVHELGHLMGLPHCNNPECVMYFSNMLADTDRKGKTFCEKCQKKLSSEFGHELQN